LSKKKKIAFLWATYEEFLIKSILGEDYDSKKFKIITDKSLDYTQKNNSKIFEIKAGYSFNKKNLNKKEDFWKTVNKFIVSQDKKNVCVICPQSYKVKLKELGENWIDKNFHYWCGGGIEGSNKFVGKTILLIIAKPELPDKSFLMEYYKVFRRFPRNCLQYDDLFKKTVIKKSLIKLRGSSRIGYKDETLNNFYKYKTINPLKDGFGRLRTMLQDNLNYLIYACCPVPDETKEICQEYQVLPLVYIELLSEIDIDFIKKIAQSIKEEACFVPTNYNVKKNRLMCKIIQEKYGLPIVYDDVGKLIKLRRGYYDEVCDTFL